MSKVPAEDSIEGLWSSHRKLGTLTNLRPEAGLLPSSWQLESSGIHTREESVLD